MPSFLEDIKVFESGLVYIKVCVPSSMGLFELEECVNTTIISLFDTQYYIRKVEMCDADRSRRHVTLTCYEFTEN